MAARESAEEKIARIVRETMAGERGRQEEEQDPNKSWLRKTIREEVGSVLGDLLNDRGDAGGRRRRAPKDDDEGDDDKGVFSLFG